MSAMEEDQQPQQRLPELPDEAWIQVGVFLTALDNLSLISSSRSKSFHLGRSARFWKALVDANKSDVATGDGLDSSPTDSDQDWKLWKQRYLVEAHCQYLPRVNWKIVRQAREDFGFHHMSRLPFRRDPPSGREGHLACALNNNSLLLVTGGFMDDDRVYIKELQQQKITTKKPMASTTPSTDDCGVRPWHAVAPSLASGGLHSVYGGSLTALPNCLTAQNSSVPGATSNVANPAPMDESDSESNDMEESPIVSTTESWSALRFGGFRAGGYTFESAQVAVLTVTRRRQTERGDPFDSQASTSHVDSYTAEWRVIPTQRQSDGASEAQNEEDYQAWEQGCVARAYHTATLLHGRYLLVLGGMSTSPGRRRHGHVGGPRDPEERETMRPLVLDCLTWTWLDNMSVVSAATSSVLETGQPLGYPVLRHGHSTIYDEARNRILVFGGGTGTDLLRSGSDRHEVWQLKRPQTAVSVARLAASLNQDDFLGSLPWEWTKLHDLESEDSPGNEDDRTGDGSDMDRQQSVASPSDTRGTVKLSLADRLPLGRCHMSHKVSSNTVLFMFGSGRPCTTNGLLAYDLVQDNFFLPGGIDGPLPIPRFTAVSVFFPESGQVFVHGGFSTQESGTTSQAAVLQLVPPHVLDMCATAPGGDPEEHRLRKVLSLDASFPFEPRAQSSQSVTQESIDRQMMQQRRMENGVSEMLRALLGVDPGDRPEVAQELYRHGITGGVMGDQAIALLLGVATGQFHIQEASDDSSENSEDDA